MQTRLSLLFLAIFTLFTGSVLAANITCYHVLEASCRSETTDDHIGFAAMSWAIKGGSILPEVENCANSYDVQLDFLDFLNESTDTTTELCRTGSVALETVHEYRRSKDKEKALTEYRSLARQCMEDDRFEKCVTFEDLDLIHAMGNSRTLLKGRMPARRGEYSSQR